MTGPGGRGRHRAPRAEGGETLVEVLASVMLMGIALIGILSALFTVQAAEDSSRRSSRLDTAIHRVVEAVEARTGTNAYKPCATPATYQLPALGHDYQATVTAVTYWDGVTTAGTAIGSGPSGPIYDPNHPRSPNYDPSRGNHTLRFIGTCSPDYGLQQITLRVRSDDSRNGRLTREITVIKRNPACPGNPTDLSC